MDHDTPATARVVLNSASDLFVLDVERAWLDIGTPPYSTSNGGASWTRLATFDHLGSLDFVNAAGRLGHGEPGPPWVRTPWRSTAAPTGAGDGP